MPGKILVDVGIKINEKQVRSAFESAFSSLENFGDGVNISDDFKKQINEMIDEVKRLQDKYDSMSHSKLTTSTFEKEKASIIEQVNAIEQRTSVLEDTMRSLISTLSSADSSGFSSWINEVKGSMENLKDTTTETVNAIGKVTKSFDGRTQFHIVDSAEDQAKKLREALNLLEKVNDGVYNSSKYKGTFDGEDIYDGVDAIAKKINEYVKLRSKLNSIDKDSPDFSVTYKKMAESAHDIASLIDQVKRTFGDSIFDQNVVKKTGGGYFTVGDYLERIENEAESHVKSINNILESLGTTGFTKAPNTVYIDFDTEKSTSGLTAKLKRAINATQKYADSNPIEVQINLATKYNKQSKKYSEAFKKMQDNISKIEDEETRTQFSGLLDEVGKGWGKEIAFELKTSLGETEAELTRIIKSVDSQLKKTKFAINPEIKFEKDSITKAQEELNNIAGFNIDNLEKYVSSIKEIVELYNQFAGKKEMGADAISIGDDIKSITANLEKLLNTYKELNNISEPSFDVEKIANTLKALDSSTAIDTSLFGKDITADILHSFKPEADPSSGDYYTQWANNIVSATDRAGVSLDAFVIKQKQLESSTQTFNIDPDQFKKLETVISNLENTLLEFSEVYQKVNGVLSESNLKKEFNNVSEAAQKLNGSDLRKTQKELKEVLDLYQNYRGLGGTQELSELSGVDKKIIKSLDKKYNKSLETEPSSSGIKEEAESFNVAEQAANAATVAKERFAQANRELLESIISSVNGIDNEGKAFENINKLFNTVGRDVDGTKAEKLLKALQEIQNIMATPVGADSFIKSLENLASTGDALKDLATVLKSTKKQIDNAKKTLGEQETLPAVDYSQDKINRNLDDIRASGKKVLENYGQVIGTIVRENKNGLIEMVGQVRTANNELSEMTITSASGQYWDIKNTETNTPRILKQAQKLEQIRRTFERMNKSPSNVTGEIMFDKDNVDSDDWELMISKAREYYDQIGNLQKVTRQVRQDRDGRLLESFSFIGDKGHVTMGREGDIVASSQELSSLEKVKEGFEELTKSAMRYNELRTKRETKEGLTSHEAAELDELDSKYKKLISDVEEYNREFGNNNIGQTALDRYLQASSKQIDENIAKYIDGAEGKFARNALQKANQSTDYTPAFKAQIAEAKAMMDELNNLRGKYKSGDIWDVNDLLRVNDIFEKINTTLKGLGDNSNVLAKTADVDKLIQKASKDLNDNTMSSGLKARYQDLVDELMRVRSAGDGVAGDLSQIDKITMNHLKAQFQELHAEMERTGQTGKGFFKQFTGAITSKSAQFLAQYFSLQDFIRYGRELGQTVTEINSAQTELRKVSDASQTRIAENFEHSAATAQELGSTITDVINNTADWARLGYSVDDAEKLARVTSIYQTVGDNMTQETASESLISTMKGFQLDADQAESVVDRINEVANNYAIDTAGIGEALQRSASAFNTAHTDLDKSIAIITASNTVLQDPEKVGTMWNTVAMRIRGASTE